MKKHISHVRHSENTAAILDGYGLRTLPIYRFFIQLKSWYTEIEELNIHVNFLTNEDSRIARIQQLGLDLVNSVFTCIINFIRTRNTNPRPTCHYLWSVNRLDIVFVTLQVCSEFMNCTPNSAYIEFEFSVDSVWRP